MSYSTVETIDVSLYDRLAFNAGFYWKGADKDAAYSEYQDLFCKLAPIIVERCADNINLEGLGAKTLEPGGMFQLSTLPGVTWQLHPKFITVAPGTLRHVPGHYYVTRHADYGGREYPLPYVAHTPK